MWKRSVGAGLIGMGRGCVDRCFISQSQTSARRNRNQTPSPSTSSTQKPTMFSDPLRPPASSNFRALRPHLYSLSIASEVNLRVEYPASKDAVGTRERPACQDMVPLCAGKWMVHVKSFQDRIWKSHCRRVLSLGNSILELIKSLPSPR
ncbi:hypothetical protein JAAARDRAFT_661131 [Jaapia argillacea MUCL 33604]|uniref:Uncharacterized protein n=1 Tax=Jaapia argillacea MUCL 33604 TaxID=933084 RepID=A0A067P329_9AGAM|nr:hypothetical protein JAAARDRAFT_661131 [Jaapia argillacea MUCL 33604]